MIKNIEIPGIQSMTPFIEAYSSYNGTDDHTIGLSDRMYQFMARQIINEEMGKVRAANSTMDYGKIQLMIDSSDREMNDLAWTMLERVTTYTVPLLKNMKSGAGQHMREIINNYISDNLLKI